MTDSTQESLKLDIDRDACYVYCCRFFILFGLVFWGVGIVVTFFLVKLWFHQYIREWADRLEYELRSDSIRIYKWYFLGESTRDIPYKRIQDIMISQGPLQRWAGIKSLRIQTAGAGAQRAEGQLLGVIDPEPIRDAILERVEQERG